MARIEQSELASAAKVSVDTIKRLEKTIGPVSANVTTVNSIARVLEAAGIEFTNGDRPGVRLRPTYSIGHLVNVVQRFQQNVLSRRGWEDVKLEPLNNGFEFWSGDKMLGRVTVEDGQAMFEPDLQKPRTREDGWVTEDELRYWAQSLRG